MTTPQNPDAGEMREAIAQAIRDGLPGTVEGQRWALSILPRVMDELRLRRDWLPGDPVTDRMYKRAAKAYEADALSGVGHAVALRAAILAALSSRKETTP